jgi:anti-sigma factor RsiW
MNRHLGDRLTAFIDGEVDPGTRDRMLGHLAQCTECRVEADQERQVKARLSALGEPKVPVELMLGLLSLDTSRGLGSAAAAGGSNSGFGGGGGFGSGGPGAAAGAPSPFSFQTVPIRPPAAPAAGRPVSERAPVRPQRLRVAAIGAVSLAAIGTGAWLVSDLGTASHPNHAVVPAGVVQGPAK